VLAGLSIEQVRCFSSVDVTFSPPAAAVGHGGWTILVGENGTGKTTLLQAIVLASVDERAVSALVEAPWSLPRQGQPATDGFIRLRCSSPNAGESERVIPATEGHYITPKASLLAPSGDSVWRPLLMAFAARRRIARPGESPPSENLELERVRGLFDVDQALLRHDAFAAFDSNAQRRAFAAVVRDVLLSRLPDDAALFPLVNGLELRGKGGVTRMKQLLEGRRFDLLYGEEFAVRVALPELSDGYQSMFALVTEILIQAALAERAVPDPKNMRAVILIDEIEAHLHPRWQRTVVPLLRLIFPQCQFLVTTHSPLVVASAEAGEVHVLQVEPEGYVTQETLDVRLAMHGADRIYQEVFGVFRTAPPDLVQLERRYLKETAVTGTQPDTELSDEIESAWRDAL
jgi:hypothetical protein